VGTTEVPGIGYARKRRDVYRSPEGDDAGRVEELHDREALLNRIRHLLYYLLGSTGRSSPAGAPHSMTRILEDT